LSAYLDGHRLRKLIGIFKSEFNGLGIVYQVIITCGTIIVHLGIVEGVVSVVKTCEDVGVITMARVKRRS
jgi:hypothetical protein